MMVNQTPSGTSQLVAYVLPGNVRTDDALDRCRSQLPAFMVPAVVVALDRWPLTSSGKIDRKQLPSLLGQSSAKSPQYREYWWGRGRNWRNRSKVFASTRCPVP